MKHSLVLYPDPVLNKPGKPVENVTDTIRALTDEMRDIMIAHEGIGLAAPQVNELLRLLIVRKGDTDEYEAFINPEITKESKKKVVTEEGCLSLPGIFGYVERAAKITVKYTDINGNKQVKKATALEAIVLQHEIDHINGILIIDRPIELTKGGELL